jgi:MFS family permease
VAFVPAALSVVVLGLIAERPGVPYRRESMLAAWKTLSPGFKRYLVAAGIFSLAYFSFGFLLLRANQAGFAAREIVLLYALFNVSFVIAAPLVGKLGDRVGRKHVVALSYLVYMVMSLGFAFAAAKWQIILLFALYGVFFSIDDAQSKAFIADVEPERRATAMGVYNFATGALYLPASLVAGALWAMHPSLVFLLAAGLALAAAGAFLWLRPGRETA